MLSILILLVMAIPMIMRLKLSDESFRSSAIKSIYSKVTVVVCAYIVLNLAILVIDLLLGYRLPVLFVLAQVYLLIYLIVMKSVGSMYSNSLHRTYTISALVALAISAFAH